ncbi:hypothetical protein V2J09_003932 [Rumex salicifolius]
MPNHYPDGRRESLHLTALEGRNNSEEDGMYVPAEEAPTKMESKGVIFHGRYRKRLLYYEVRRCLSYVLRQGPWLIGNSYLTIQRWHPNFIAGEENLHFVAVWVRIPNLSMEYFDRGPPPWEKEEGILECEWILT